MSVSKFQQWLRYQHWTHSRCSNNCSSSSCTNSSNNSYCRSSMKRKLTLSSLPNKLMLRWHQYQNTNGKILFYHIWLYCTLLHYTTLVNILNQLSISIKFQYICHSPCVNIGKLPSIGNCLSGLCVNNIIKIFKVYFKKLKYQNLKLETSKLKNYKPWKKRSKT